MWNYANVDALCVAVNKKHLKKKHLHERQMIIAFHVYVYGTYAAFRVVCFFNAGQVILSIWVMYVGVYWFVCSVNHDTNETQRKVRFLHSSKWYNYMTTHLSTFAYPSLCYQHQIITHAEAWLWKLLPKCRTHHFGQLFDYVARTCASSTQPWRLLD